MGVTVVGMAVAISFSIATRSTETRRVTGTPACPAATATPSHAEREHRPLVYAEGRRIHVGPRTVQAPRPVLSLDVVDGGAAFTTLDGGVWFTDGTEVELVGTATPGRATDSGILWGRSGKPRGWVVSDNAGSRMAWLEYPRHDHAEIVVYDARERRRVARVPVEAKPSCPNCVRVVSVGRDHVLWTDGVWHGLGTMQLEAAGGKVRRIELETGRHDSVPRHCAHAALRQRPRMLLVGGSPEDSELLTDGVSQEFMVRGGRLADRATPGTVLTDTGTGRRLDLRMPPSYGPAQRLTLFQWLDDRRFALIDATDWSSLRPRGERLLVCHLGRGSCELLVSRQPSAGSPILPEIWTPGAERSLERAVVIARRPSNTGAPVAR